MSESGVLNRGSDCDELNGMFDLSSAYNQIPYVPRSSHGSSPETVGSVRGRPDLDQLGLDGLSCKKTCSTSYIDLIGRILAVSIPVQCVAKSLGMWLK